MWIIIIVVNVSNFSTTVEPFSMNSNNSRKKKFTASAGLKYFFRDIQFLFLIEMGVAKSIAVLNNSLAHDGNIVVSWPKKYFNSISHDTKDSSVFVTSYKTGFLVTSAFLNTLKLCILLILFFPPYSFDGRSNIYLFRFIFLND